MIIRVVAGAAIVGATRWVALSPRAHGRLTAAPKACARRSPPACRDSSHQRRRAVRAADAGEGVKVSTSPDAPSAVSGEVSRSL